MILWSIMKDTILHETKAFSISQSAEVVLVLSVYPIYQLSRLFQLTHLTWTGWSVQDQRNPEHSSQSQALILFYTFFQRPEKSVWIFFFYSNLREHAFMSDETAIGFSLKCNKTPNIYLRRA